MSWWKWFHFLLIFAQTHFLMNFSILIKEFFCISIQNNVQTFQIFRNVQFLISTDLSEFLNSWGKITWGFWKYNFSDRISFLWRISVLGNYFKNSFNHISLTALLARSELRLQFGDILVAPDFCFFAFSNVKHLLLNRKEPKTFMEKIKSL